MIFTVTVVISHPPFPGYKQWAVHMEPENKSMRRFMIQAVRSWDGYCLSVEKVDPLPKDDFQLQFEVKRVKDGIGRTGGRIKRPIGTPYRGIPVSDTESLDTMNNSKAPRPTWRREYDQPTSKARPGTKIFEVAIMSVEDMALFRIIRLAEDLKIRDQEDPNWNCQDFVMELLEEFEREWRLYDDQEFKEGVGELLQRYEGHPAA